MSGVRPPEGTTRENVSRALAIRPQALPPGPVEDAEPLPWSTPLGKAAVILAAVGPEIAAPLLTDMSESDLQRLAAVVAELRRVPPAALDRIIGEFMDALGDGRSVAGGSEAARRLLAKVLGEAEAARLMAAIEGRDRRTVWVQLQDLPATTVAAWLADEHPQTAATVLRLLRADYAAEVLERMPRSEAQAAVLRLGASAPLDPAVQAALEAVIGADVLPELQRRLGRGRPADTIAGMMTNVSDEAREAFLTALGARAPSLAEEVQKVMFTFPDIPERIAPRDVPAIVRAIDEPTLLAALGLARARGQEAVVAHLLANLPKRLSERLAEELEASEPPAAKTGEAAQLALVKAITGLIARGVIKARAEDGA